MKVTLRFIAAFCFYCAAAGKGKGDANLFLDAESAD